LYKWSGKVPRSDEIKYCFLSKKIFAIALLEQPADIAIMATAAVATIIQPEHLEVKESQIPNDQGFDPIALKNKYLQERDKRLRHNTEGVDQYRMIDGSLSHYITDPHLGDIIERVPLQEECEVVIIGGGYGGQLVAVRLLEAGVKNIKIIEKGGNFGGTWYISS
jgi:NADPH-dependent 2,4-dienoyl-CoA reductase/sulfur reductase-like enzyme